MFSWLRGLFRSKPVEDPEPEETKPKIVLKPIERELVYVLLINQRSNFWAVAVDSAETAIKVQSILLNVYKDLSIRINRQVLKETGDITTLDGATLA